MDQVVTDQVVTDFHTLTEVVKKNQVPIIVVIIKTSYERLCESISNIDMILKLMGLYLKNIYYFHGDTTLNYLLPKDVCYDLFNNNTCNTKIDKLLYKPSTMKGGSKIKKNSNKTKKNSNKKELFNKRNKIYYGGAQVREKLCSQSSHSEHYCGDEDRVQESNDENKTENMSSKMASLQEYISEFIVKNPDLPDINLKIEWANAFKNFTPKTFNSFIIRILGIIQKSSEAPTEAPAEALVEALVEAPEQLKPDDGVLGKNQIINLSYPFSINSKIVPGILKTIQTCNKIHLGIDQNKDADYTNCNILCKCKDCTVSAQNKLKTPYKGHYTINLYGILILIDTIIQENYEININYEASLLMNLESLSKEDRKKLYDDLKKGNKKINELYKIEYIKKKIRFKDEEKELGKIFKYLEKINFMDHFIDYFIDH